MLVAPSFIAKMKSESSKAWLYPCAPVSQNQNKPRDENETMIHTSLRAGLCLLALAGAHAADWTSFKPGRLGSYSLNYSHLPDGRFILGTGGTVAVQKTFGNVATASIPVNGLTLDPSFTAVASPTVALVGAGGFAGPSGVHPFNPSAPGSGITATALATLQNYNGVFWKHPTSGRQGWFIGGGNGTAGAHNITFVSTDGTKVGAITGDLCTYSAGLAVDAQGNLYTGLFELPSSPNAADAEKVLKFTAAQVDAAVEAVILGSPAPVARSSATLVHQFLSAASIAVDGLGRIWGTGYGTGNLEVFDPVLNASRTFVPDHPTLADAAGAPTYLLSTFRRNGVDYVSYLALDSFYTQPSDIAYGYRPAEQLMISKPELEFATAIQSVDEAAGTATVTVSLSVPGTTRITVPYTLTGLAKRRVDYNAPSGPLVFERGEVSKTITVTLIDDVLDETDEILVLTLGNPSPIWAADLGANLTHTLTITDNDTPPVFAAGDSLMQARVGAGYSAAVAMVMDPNPTTTRFSAKGLPPGMRIDPLTGIISGRPTVAGEYYEIVITATNATGTTRSQAFVLLVEDFADLAKGSFIALSDRLPTTLGNLGMRLDLTVTSSAAYTAKLHYGGKTYSKTDVLDTMGVDPTGSFSVSVLGVGNIEVNFQIDASNGAISGTVKEGLFTASLTGWRGRGTSTITGLHHFAAPLVAPTPTQPAGATHGAVTLGASGTTLLAGRLADGTSFASSGLLGPNREVIVYQVLYAVPGSILGTLTVAPDYAQSISGSMSWSKPQQRNSSSAHPDGWSAPITLIAEGGRYRPVAGSTIVLNLPASAGTNAQLTFSGADVDASASEPDIALRILAPATVAQPNIHKLKINVAKGTFSGTIVLQEAVGKRSASFEGRLIPNVTTPAVFDGVGKGFFLLTPLTGGPKASGMVSLTP